MAILIDPPAWNAHGRRWSHLISDVSLEELHAFTRGLGLSERLFEGDHYDVPEEHYAAMVAAGAVAVTSRELLVRLRASGLRRSKRRGERVLASHPGAGDVRIDTLLSPHPPTGSVHAVTVVLRRERLVLTLPAPGHRLPRRATNGAAPPVTAEQLIIHTVGRVMPAAPTQLGLLRSVGGDGGPATFEVVVLSVLPADLALPREPDGEWLAPEEAAALVAAPVAPLLRYLA
jgi:hypothetical protein